MRIHVKKWPIVLRAAAVFAALTLAAQADAQLRIVTYNTATAHPATVETPTGRQTAPASAATVLAAIGDEVIGGIHKPIDILLLQEQWSVESATQSFVTMLNNIYGAGVYARGTVNGGVADAQNRAGRPGMVYNTQTVQLIDDTPGVPDAPGELAFGNVGSFDGNGNPALAQQPRSTLRYHFRPLGYGASADFYTYNSHYLSGTGTDQNNRRLAEATSIRTNADALGEGVSIIYAGDYNIQTSSGTAYQHLLSAGNGQAFDPINEPGTPVWFNKEQYKHLHTQSPATVEQFEFQSLGGMNDRFDFQHITGELQDGEGISYITGSYHAFGNNGSHTRNADIATGSGASLNVLTALITSSDHLPVVADYQLPAKMDVDVASVPMFVEQGATISLDLTVTNIAPALTSLSADELDYTISVLGGWGTVVGPATDVDPARDGGDFRQIALNTSTLGAKSGMLQVASSSQGAADAFFEVPISFTVIDEFLAADFDEDGFVDGDDLAAWESNFGDTGAIKYDGDADLDGDVDGSDFLTWQRQLGTSPAATAAGAPVPEPSSQLLGVFAVMLTASARRLSTRFRDRVAVGVT